MSIFDKREDTFEKKFAHDEELRFRAIARRDALLARWAAEKLGKKDDAIESYVTDVLNAELRGAGRDSVFQKLRSDFEQAGVALSDHRIRAKMDSLLQTALADLRATG